MNPIIGSQKGVELTEDIAESLISRNIELMFNDSFYYGRKELQKLLRRVE